MLQLAPCPACARHVDVRAIACPFCGAPTPGLSPKPMRAVTSLTRGAIVYMGAVLAGACGPEPVAQPYGAPPDDRAPDEQVLQPYGAPPDPEVPDDPPPPPEADEGAGDEAPEE